MTRTGIVKSKTATRGKAAFYHFAEEGATVTACGVDMEANQFGWALVDGDVLNLHQNLMSDRGVTEAITWANYGDLNAAVGFQIAPCAKCQKKVTA